MPEQPNELRRIIWSECFPFTHLFRTFKLAVHPNKLVLALVAVLLTGLWGWLLDVTWSAKHHPVNGEVNAFWQVQDLDAWRAMALANQARQIRAACGEVEVALSPDFEDRFRNEPVEASARALKDIRSAYDKALDKLAEAHRDGDQSKSDKAAGIADVARRHRIAYQTVRDASPRGVFRSFASFEGRVAQQLLEAARGLNLTGGLNEVMTARVAAGSADPAAALRAALGQRPDAASILVPVKSGPDGLGVLSCLVLAVRGKQWLVTQHFWFFLLFSLPVLALWALAGGAICRIAALNIAREEHISIKAALAFAQRKLAGLFVAPLFPGLLVIVVGVLMIVGGLVMAIPVVGEIIGGIGLGLALPGGFIMAAVIVGALAGGGLMWPTIAVEGSDSFDAMSRSYSYVYARPWRTAFYAGVALVYGAICYLFVRIFLLLALKAVRLFVGLGLSFTARPGTGIAEATKLDTLWPAPSFQHLRGISVPFGMEGAEAGGAFIICLWLTVAVGLLYAFVASFYLSGATVIYYLLRQVVDGTDYEDVYTEEEDNEGGEEFPAAQTGAPSGSTSLPIVEAAAPSPPATPPPAAAEADEGPGADSPPEEKS